MIRKDHSFILMIIFWFVFGTFISCGRSQNSASSKDIDSIESSFKKTELLLKKGKQKDAENIFLETIKNMPPDYSFLDVYKSLGLTADNYPYYLYLLGHYYSDKRELKKAVDVYSKIINEYPKSYFPQQEIHFTTILLSIQAQIELAEVLEDINPLESIKEYKKAIEKYSHKKAVLSGPDRYSPTDIESHALLKIGFLYEDIEDYEKAIHSYKKVVKCFPHYYEHEYDYPAATAQMRIVRIYRHLRYYKKAIEEATKALEMDYHEYIEESGYPTLRVSRAEALWNISEIYKEVGEYEKSLEYFNKVIDDYPAALVGNYGAEPDRTYGQRAVDQIRDIYKKLYGVERAISELRKIAKSKDGNTAAYAQYTIASIYELELKDIARAIQEYRKVLKNHPGSGGYTHEDAEPLALAEEKIAKLTKK
jgi:tetratricopeptide (TPR) repeat protein